MKRGEIWTVAGLGITPVSRDLRTESITICVMTADPAAAPLFRVPIVPNERNGLNTLSRLMVDKIITVAKNKLGHRIGRLYVKDIERVDQAVLIFLDLGG